MAAFYKYNIQELESHSCFSFLLREKGCEARKSKSEWKPKQVASRNKINVPTLTYSFFVCRYSI